MTKTLSVLCLAALLLAVPAGLACSHRERVGGENAATPAPGQHWVQDAKVREVMKQIAAATASWPQDLPPHAEAANPIDLERAFADSARLANTLAKAASDIPATVAERQIPDVDRRGFIKHAQTLRRHALELQEAARLHRVAEMQRALGRINTTCFACHSAYRGVAGELD